MANSITGARRVAGRPFILLAIVFSTLFLLQTTMAAELSAGGSVYFHQHEVDSSNKDIHINSAETDKSPSTDPQSRFTSENLDSNNDNPQQSGGLQQVIDTDTYGGRKPDTAYPTHDPAWSSLTPDEALRTQYPPGPALSVDPDIRQLAETMTLRELAGQMTQIQIGMLIDSKGELDVAKVEYWIREWGVGSFLDTPSK